MNRNAIALPFDLTKRQQAYVWTGVGVASLLGIYLLYRAFKKKGSRLYYPGDEVQSIQGGQFTVRLPRGDYIVSSPDLQKITEVDLGTSTDVVLMVVTQSADTYTINTTLVDQQSGKSYPLSVVAFPHPAQRA